MRNRSLEGQKASADKYQMIREYAEFRLADDEEISKMKATRAHYKLLRILKKLKIDNAWVMLRI